MNTIARINACCLVIILIVLLCQQAVYAVNVQNSLIPFSGDISKRYTASTVHFDQSKYRGSFIEEAPPEGVCIGSGDYPCICTNCKCCTTECRPCKTSPVISGSGYERVETDLVVQGKGFPYQFTRYYLSANKNIGSLGLAWYSNLDIGLVVVGDLKAYFQDKKTSPPATPLRHKLKITHPKISNLV